MTVKYNPGADTMDGDDEQILRELMDRAFKSVENLASDAPLTTLQIGLGLCVAVSFRDLLIYHRGCLLTRSAFRAVTQFLVIGDSIWSSLGSAVSLALVQGSLEPALNASRRSEPSMKLSSKTSLLSLIRSAIQRSSLSPYLIATLLSGSCLVVIDALGLPFLSSTNSSYYSLFPALDASMQWLWAFVSGPRQLSTGIFGMSLGLDKVHPVWLPLLSILFGGRQRWGHAISGLIAALLTSHLMDLRIGRDSVFDSTVKELLKAARTLRRALVRIYRQNTRDR